jgi:hypothetical protein
MFPELTAAQSEEVADAIHAFSMPRSEAMKRVA